MESEAWLDLNDQLQILLSNISDPIDSWEQFDIKEIEAKLPKHMIKVLRICHHLLFELATLDESLLLPNNLQETLNSLSKIYTILETRGLCFSIDSKLLDYELLHYLMTEIQVNKLIILFSFN